MQYLLGITPFMLRYNWAGIEVPVIGLDSIKWHQVSLPADSSSSSSSSPIAPLTKDAAGSCFVTGGEPRTYLIWRIHEELPHVLELLELNPDKDLPRNGLRIIFPVALCPFAYICKDESAQISCTPGNSYLMHALSTTGVAYLVKLRSHSTYTSHSVISKCDFVEFNLQTYPNVGKITAVGATPGRLLVGKTDGSVCIFQLGMPEQTTPGFEQELRGEATGLRGLMSRNKTPGCVVDLVITEVKGRKILFVLSIDRVVQAWDLSNHSRIFYNTMTESSYPSFTSGGTPLKLWVGELDSKTRKIQLSISYEVRDRTTKPFNIYYLNCKAGGRIKLSLKKKYRSITLSEEEITGMKLTPKKVWVITKKRLTLIHLRSRPFPHHMVRYVPQSIYVADQVYQYLGHDWDNLLSITRSLFSSAEDRAVPFVSSMCLRRLLQPGVYNDIDLRATMQDYNKNWADSDFESLTVDQIRKEITSLIAHEANDESLTSIVYGWKLFFTRYLQHWRKSNALFGIFGESSTGAVCLIKKHSLSLFRCLKDIEMLIKGSIEKLGSEGLGLGLGSVKDSIIYEILVCANYLNLYIGRSASAICYESLVQTTSSSEEIISIIVKMLKTGSVPSLAYDDTPKEFTVGMIFKLRTLCKIATKWSNVLNAIQSYLDFLAPHKTCRNFDSEVLFNINTSVCVQSTIQVARMMFGSAFDILLLLRYLVHSSARIHMSHTEVSRIQSQLVPMTQEILKEWLIVHYIGTTPSQCPDGRFERRSPCTGKLGTCDFTLPFVLLIDSKGTSAVDNRQCSTRALPSPQSCTTSIHDFTSWVAWGTTDVEEKPCSLKHLIKITSVLLRHGQYDAVETLLNIVEAHTRNGESSESIKDNNGERCTLFHLKGCALLAQAHFGLPGLLKEQKVSEAVRCFFRASSGEVAPESLLNLCQDTKSSDPGFIDCESVAAWKLQYYKHVMQKIEEYNLSDGACVFALAALEQPDEALM